VLGFVRVVFGVGILGAAVVVVCGMLGPTLAGAVGVEVGEIVVGRVGN
jgi:hypothetical protein